jgi:hypothetical protein
MFNKFIKLFSLFLLLASAGLLTSCEKEDTLSDTENFILQSTFEIQERSGVGMRGCYELVFPVTIQFADSTSQEVDGYEALKLAIREWFVANKGTDPRPARPYLVMPYDVINDAGEVITIETKEELGVLRKACIQDKFDKDRPGHGSDRPCFKPVFPLSIEFPNGTVVTFDTPQALRHALHAWKKDHPGATDHHPMLVFPITVKMADGTLVVVNNKEELRALKEDCRG